jgi:hypothetical protein
VGGLADHPFGRVEGLAVLGYSAKFGHVGCQQADKGQCSGCGGRVDRQPGTSGGNDCYCYRSADTCRGADVATYPGSVNGGGGYLATQSLNLLDFSPFAAGGPETVAATVSET